MNAATAVALAIGAALVAFTAAALRAQWRPLALLALALSACIPLGTDADLTALARAEWARVGPPERFADPAPIVAQVCVGSPGFLGTTAYVPWPWSEWPAASRLILRYELAKLAWQLHGVDADGSRRWYWLPLFIDGLLHLPPSELHSWYRALVPGERKHWSLIPDEAGDRKE